MVVSKRLSQVCFGKSSRGRFEECKRIWKEYKRTNEGNITDRGQLPRNIKRDLRKWARHGFLVGAWPNGLF